MTEQEFDQYIKEILERKNRVYTTTQPILAGGYFTEYIKNIIQRINDPEQPYKKQCPHSKFV